MTISYLSYTTSDHPPNYQSFITILIFRKKVAHYMFLLKLLSCIKASFSFQKRRDIFDVQTYELRSDNSFTPVPILIAIYAIYAIFPPNQDQFFQRVGGYENIEIHLKFFKHMYNYIEFKKLYSISCIVFNCLSLFILCLFCAEQVGWYRKFFRMSYI